MPPKAEQRDWDRYFRAGAPRRGGPGRVLATLLVVGISLSLLGGAAFFALRYGLDQARVSTSSTAFAIETANAIAISTATARTLDATSTAAALAATSAVVTPTVPAEPVIGQSSVLNAGNLRSEPVVADTTVIGQICIGDQVDILEQRTLDDGNVWFRLRLTVPAASCSPQHVSAGSVGWASATLISAPTP